MVVPNPSPEGAEPAPIVDDPFIGREIAGKYRIVRRLGAGGMGAVYLARHSATGGDVALKFLHGTALGDESAVKRFQLEAQNSAALRHANTVRVTDFGVDSGTFYLVMEYLAGHSLADVLQRDGAMPWRRAVHIVRQVLKALWEAHEHPRQIIHRDIKPANIFLVDLPGEPDHVRVLDFGIARSLSGSGAGTQGLIGTPFYMAPELWRGDPVDARTDLYALGCVAYQMLAGAPPFVPPPSATESLYPLLTMHMNEPPPALPTVRAGVPAPLVAWVDRLLAKDPAARPPSARIALEALDEAVARIGPEAGHASTMPPDKHVPLPSELPPATVTVRGPDPVRSGLPTWLAIGIGLVLLGGLAAVIAVAASGSASDSPVAGRATRAGAKEDEPRVAPDVPHPAYGTLIVSYRARLSAADHTDEDGASLDDAAAVVTLDRLRYHAGVGDPEDGAETVFGSEEMQGKLYHLVATYLDEPSRRAVLEGRPLVEVSIYERGLALRVLAP